MKTVLIRLVWTLAVIPSISAFVCSGKISLGWSLNAIKVPVIPAEGDRTILDGPDGPIIVAKVNGSLFATSAICPHLGLPMKTGKIDPKGAGGDPELTCKFHNSCFNMKTGKCTKWVTGALGVQNNFIAGVMSKVGSEKKDLKTYTVVTEKDGSVSLQ